jgi:F0F1-type ATP synthase assembly protein I
MKSEKAHKEGYYITLGIVLGLPLGVPVGLVLGNIALGEMLGLIAGLTVGWILERKNIHSRIELTVEERGRLRRTMSILLAGGIVAFVVVTTVYLIRSTQ